MADDMMIQCPDCKGRGTQVAYSQMYEPELCERCKGAKVIPYRETAVYTPRYTYAACDCHGGRTDHNVECPKCKGEGVVATRIG